MFINKYEEEAAIGDLKDFNSEEPNFCDQSGLVDIRSVTIRSNLPKEERIKDFIEQIKNPYLYKCGDMVTHSVFSDPETSLTERIKQYFRIV